ncbi:hypothetical protein F8388_021987 [Cannabis sativa]|uniref:Transmembrane protein n=1 Tax=Cannabis sativa TaxID=3483 RepID=A0A7J6FG23_CANSA|nr:hypothetical protein F8388_021987 [Cannabis sativa]
MEDALRESKPYTDRLFSRARRVWSWILSWVLCGPRRRTRMEVTIVVVVSSVVSTVVMVCICFDNGGDGRQL